MISLRSLSDSKSPLVSRTLLSILANLNSAVVWMVSTSHLISKSSSPFANPLMTVPRAPCYTFFFNSLGMSRYLSFFSLSFNFTLWSTRTAKFMIRLSIIIIIIILLIRVFDMNLSDSKSPQVSRTLLSILTVLIRDVVWMVSTRPPTCKSFSPFNYSLVTIGIIVTFMFHSFFQFPSKVEVLILLFTFFRFYSVVSRDSKVDNFANSLLFLLLLLGLVFWPIFGDPSGYQSPKRFMCVIF